MIDRSFMQTDDGIKQTQVVQLERQNLARHMQHPKVEE